jgi:hypothetical protein
MTLPTTDTKPKERASLLVRGVGLLFLSLLAEMLLTNISDSDGVRGRLLLGWAEQVTFWLGIICIGGFVLAEVLRGRSR